MNLTTEYFFTLRSIDKSPITKKTEVPSLEVKAYKIPTEKRDIVFWYNLKDIPNPEKVIQPGINMYVKTIEEVEPNLYVLKDHDDREFSLRLMYVSEQEIR